MYMDLSFKVTNPINKDGKIEITYNNVEMHTTNWKYDENVANG